MTGEPPREPDKIDLKADVSGQARIGKIVQIGKQVINQVDQKLFKRLGLEMRLGFGLVALLVALVLVGVGAILYRLKPAEVNMKLDPGCEFCIAVAGFAEVGQEAKGVGDVFATNLSKRIRENLAELETDMTLEVWGPVDAGSVSGDSLPELDASAKELAKRISADLVVYGIVDTSKQPWQVTPLFYISEDYAFEDAAEFVGQDELGVPFPARGDTRALRLKIMNDEATPRGKTLAALTVGLLHYLTGDYSDAQAVFKTALQDAQRWGDPAVIKLINLFLGNSLGKQIETTHNYDLIDQAEAYFGRAREIDPQYARAYIGLGSLAYLRSQVPAQETNDPADIDQGWLEQSMAYYNQARDLAVEPDLAHVREKAAMWIGQDYFTSEYRKSFATGEAPDYSAAVAEFKKVITAFERQPTSSILKELAVEAHARLGLIYRLNGNKADSINEYQQAVSLSSDASGPDIDRIDLYNRILETLQAP